MSDQTSGVAATNEPVHVSEEAFENFLASAGDKPVLVDFYADWCGPCKMIAPVVQEVAADMEGKALIGKVNVDEARATAQKYGVMSIPTLVVIKNGQVVDKTIGFAPKAKLEEMLTKQLPKAD